MLQTLDDVGLGYVQLGQAAPTLSAGEAQRVKLATELGRPSTGKTVYLLDEPTTGLHFDDIKKLLNVLHRLVDRGNTCICIEHNLDVIKTADWLIDLGPEAGQRGGEIVVEGTPEQVARCTASHTGRSLKPILESGPRANRNAQTAKLPDEPRARANAPVDLGQGVPMPWERNGKMWHTETHVDHEGKPCAWDARVLEWLVDAIESVGEFAPTDWAHRSLVEIKAAGAERWFCHFRTGDTELLNLAVRVPRGSLVERDVLARVRIPTLDERADLPIYGQWNRIRKRNSAEGWEEWNFYLRDFSDFSRKEFRWFLKTAADAYLGRAEEQVSDPLTARPWLSNGRAWHLSQKSINHRDMIQWKPSLLLEMLGQFKKLHPRMEVDWANQTAVGLHVDDRSKHVAKIVTNQRRGLRVEIRTPAGLLTPTQVERLGTDVSIKRAAAYDRVAFWVHALDQVDVRQLGVVWRECRRADAAEPVSTR
jgi:excinuclease ABC subunit A